MVVNDASRAAVVGVGTTMFGALGRSADDLAAEALQAALSDAGVPAAAVDGLAHPSRRQLRASGGRARNRPAMDRAGAARGAHDRPAIQLAAAAIRAGLCRTVALVHGNDGHTRGATYGSGNSGSSPAGEGYGTTPQLTAPYGMTSPGAFSALMLQRHRHLYGTTEDSLPRWPRPSAPTPGSTLAQCTATR